MSDRPRISLLRGPYFGPFEAQNFEPLLDRFDIQAYILPQNLFDLEGCRIPTTICRFPDSIRGRSLINAFRSRVLGHKYPMPGISAIVRESRVVHTFEAWYAYTREAALACRRYGVPMVVTHWDTQPYTMQARSVLLAAYDTAAAIIAPSSRAKGALLEMGIPEEKIVSLGMGVDTVKFCPAERNSEILKTCNIDATDFIFLFIGRLAPEKGLQTLLRAFKSIPSTIHGRRVRLLIVGDGPERPILRSMVASLQLDEAVLLVSRVPYQSIQRWHQLGDVFVYPSRRTGSAEEQFGYSIVEAMSSGKPVIASRVGGIPDVIGEAGILTPEEDIDGMSNAMNQLLSDPSLRRELGNAARVRAIRFFSTLAVSEKLAEIYHRTLKNSKVSVTLRRTVNDE